MQAPESHSQMSLSGRSVGGEVVEVRGSWCACPFSSVLLTWGGGSCPKGRLWGSERARGANRWKRPHFPVHQAPGSSLPGAGVGADKATTSKQGYGLVPWGAQVLGGGGGG